MRFDKVSFVTKNENSLHYKFMLNLIISYWYFYAKFCQNAYLLSYGNQNLYAKPCMFLLYNYQQYVSL